MVGAGELGASDRAREGAGQIGRDQPRAWSNAAQADRTRHGSNSRPCHATARMALTERLTRRCPPGSQRANLPRSAFCDTRRPAWASFAASAWAWVAKGGDCWRFVHEGPRCIFEVASDAPRYSSTETRGTCENRRKSHAMDEWTMVRSTDSPAASHNHENRGYLCQMLIMINER